MDPESASFKRLITVVVVPVVLVTLLTDYPFYIDLGFAAAVALLVGGVVRLVVWLKREK